ncbi:hypothetical protein GCG21_06775 [Pseudactinotalea sp. HY160]|nr:hypothetical protein [Pseudactinotalea sp. HY160]
MIVGVPPVGTYSGTASTGTGRVRGWAPGVPGRRRCHGCRRVLTARTLALTSGCRLSHRDVVRQRVNEDHNQYGEAPRKMTKQSHTDVYRGSRRPSFGARAVGLAATAAMATAGLLGASTALAPEAQADDDVIDVEVDASVVGRTYDGVGAVSGGGATTRLLLDYPEPQRSQVLDYLFLPGYGASLEMLKVEIGGDTNATDGSESSHMHVPDVVNCETGYEWWLMQEAVERNPDINLGGLAWGAPGWLEDEGGYFSDATIDYFLNWLGCADEYGLNIDNMGVRNERTYDVEWVIKFRAALDAAGYEDVRIVASDEAAVKGEWPIAVDMAENAELRDAVDVLGNHYSFGPSSETAQALDKPLWISEGGPWSAEWGAGGPPRAISSLLNNSYLRGQITGVQFWNLLTAYYDGLSISDAGLMRSNTPWSGAYQVQAAIWTVAHTTQFVSPGWLYLDNSSAHFDEDDILKGSYVTRRAPDTGDWSMVIDRIATEDSQTMRISVDDELIGDTIHVWQSTENEWFSQKDDLTPDADGFVEVTIPADSVVTLTTTTGQGKGTAVGKNESAFPFPYHNSLSDGGPSGQTPYLSQMEGAFEVRDCVGGRDGECLTQVSPRPAIGWAPWTKPTALLGDLAWADYQVSADVWIPAGGAGEVLGRLSNDAMQPVPNGYGFSLDAEGHWTLSRGELGGKEIVELATGATEGVDEGWHRLTIRFDEDRISGLIDDVEVVQVEDATWASGMAGVASGYAPTQFADLAIEPLAPLEFVHVSDGAVAVSGSGWEPCEFGGDDCRVVDAPEVDASADGTAVTSNTAGDVLEFGFQGVQGTLTGFAVPTGGSALVSIDGNEPQTLSFDRIGDDAAVEWRTPILPAGSHTLRVEVVNGSADGGGVVVNGVQVVPNNGALSSIDDQMEGVGLGGFDYRGSGWLSCPGCINNSQLFHGSVTYSDNPGDTVSLRFVGDRVDLYGLRDSRQGQTDVMIDGRRVGTADFNGSERVGNQLIWQSEQLPMGEHVLTLMVTEESGRINVDRVVVHGDISDGGSTEEPTDDPTDEPTDVPTGDPTDEPTEGSADQSSDGASAGADTGSAGAEDISTAAAASGDADGSESGDGRLPDTGVSVAFLCLLMITATAAGVLIRRRGLATR